MDPLAPSLPVLHDRVNRWYAANARALPWRLPGTSAWAVLVSEVMSHQTPVARVEPVWRKWLARWPTPADLAAEAPGEAVRAWGRLGYPRRALRLHQAARAIVERHGGRIWVQSAGEGKGSAFHFSMPAAPPTNEVRVASSSTPV